MEAPIIAYGLLVPVFVIFGAACVGVLVEALVPRASRRTVQLFVTVLAILAALVATVLNWAAGATGLAAVNSLALDGPTYFIWTILLVFGGVSFLLFAERRLDISPFAPSASAVPGTPAEQEAIELGAEHTEVFPLALFALSGMMLFPASNDLITMFIALEILSLPLYLLCGLARRRRLLSQEAALKYFLLGALSSAFFLYGAALVYGYTGSFTLREIDIALRLSQQNLSLLLAGMGLLGIGLLFKFGAVPFHSWTPDVYTGAPTPVTAVIAVATMVVGSVLAITQTDVKRMLAYSSIAHAGFILTAFVGASQAISGSPSGALTSVSSVMFYLVAYGAATVGAFALVTMVRDTTGEATLLSSWVGLGRRSPLAASIFALFMLSFAGIPLTSGFIGKWAVFAAAWSGGAEWLVVVAVVISVVAAFFYIRVIVLMFFSEPAEVVATTKVARPGWTTLAV